MMMNTAYRMNEMNKEAMAQVNGGKIIDYNNTLYVTTDDYNEKILGTYKYYIMGDDYSVCENAYKMAVKTATVYGVSSNLSPVHRAPYDYYG